MDHAQPPKAGASSDFGEPCPWFCRPWGASLWCPRNAGCVQAAYGVRLWGQLPHVPSCPALDFARGRVRGGGCVPQLGRGLFVGQLSRAICPSFAPRWVRVSAGTAGTLWRPSCAGTRMESGPITPVKLWSSPTSMVSSYVPVLLGCPRSPALCRGCGGAGGVKAFVLPKELTPGRRAP